MKKLIYESGGYLISSIITAGFPFLLIPVITRYLSPEEYGEISIFIVYSGVVSQLICMSVLTFYAKNYYSNNKEKTLDSCFFIMLFFALVLIFAGIPLFGEDIEINFKISKLNQFLGIILSLSDEVIAAQLLLHRLSGKVFKYALFDITRVTLRSILILCCIVFYTIDAQLIINLTVICSVFLGILSLTKLYKINILRVRFDRNEISRVLRFGIALLPFSLTGTLSTTLDKIFIVDLISVKDLGIYAVGYSLGSIIKIIESSINIAFTPWLYSSLQKNELKNIVKMTYVIFLILLIAAFVVNFVLNNLITWYLPENYRTALDFFQIIAYSFTFNAFYSCSNQLLIFIEKNKIVSFISVFSTFISAIVTYKLIIIFGAIGAAYGLFIGMAIRAILTFIVANKFYPLPWLLK